MYIFIYATANDLKKILLFDVQENNCLNFAAILLTIFL